ncbi:MAG: DUF1415 domain-containing protein [Gammaproteobacteria bacterium]|nr:DUF1415 domain-containing protein [Gammaproteobacteria bacterium]
MKENIEILSSVRNWLEKIVIGENFCPFAKNPFEANSIVFKVFRALENKNEPSASIEKLLMETLSAIVECCEELDNNQNIETTLLILDNSWLNFNDFLVLIEAADEILDQCDYRGTYQVAHFHPDYQFAGVAKTAAQNFTNRSPVPIIHILREKSISNALMSVKNPEKIPTRNVLHAEKKGAAYFIEILNDL